MKRINLVKAVMAGVIVLTLAGMMAGCNRSQSSQSSQSAAPATSQPAPPAISQITIATQGVPDVDVVANMLKDIIEAKTPIQVTVTQTTGMSGLIHEMIVKGDIQLYVGYDGTEFDKIFHQDYSQAPYTGNPASVASYVQDQELKQYGIWVSPSLGFEDTYALMVPAAVAQQDNLKTFSDVASEAPNWVLGTDQDFTTTLYPDFETAYPELHFKSTLPMDYDLMYTAIATNKVPIIMGYTTDGRVAKLNLAVLADNKNHFPPYHGIVLIKDTVVQADHLDTVLAPLWGAISTSDMTKMNELVDVDSQDPAQVAHDFLVNKGII